MWRGVGPVCKHAQAWTHSPGCDSHVTAENRPQERERRALGNYHTEAHKALGGAPHRHVCPEPPPPAAGTPTPSSSAPHGRSLIATHHPFARPPCVFSPAFLAHSSVHARPVGPGSRLRTATTLAGDALVDTRTAREQEELECAAGRLHRDDEEAELADHAREDHEREHIGHELLRALAAQHLGVDFNR